MPRTKFFYFLNFAVLLVLIISLAILLSTPSERLLKFWTGKLATLDFEERESMNKSEIYSFVQDAKLVVEQSLAQVSKILNKILRLGIGLVLLLIIQTISCFFADKIILKDLWRTNERNRILERQISQAQRVMSDAGKEVKILRAKNQELLGEIAKFRFADSQLFEQAQVLEKRTEQLGKQIAFLEEFKRAVIV